MTGGLNCCSSRQCDGKGNREQNLNHTHTRHYGSQEALLLVQGKMDVRLRLHVTMHLFRKFRGCFFRFRAKRKVE
jgi:hypothetical protein